MLGFTSMMFASFFVAIILKSADAEPKCRKYQILASNEHDFERVGNDEQCTGTEGWGCQFGISERGDGKTIIEGSCMGCVDDAPEESTCVNSPNTYISCCCTGTDCNTLKKMNAVHGDAIKEVTSYNMTEVEKFEEGEGN